jgi:hypothetical protein
VHNKWIYKTKRKQDGSVERFKARLMAKGFDQRSGVDFNETFSPVIKPSTICAVLTLAVHFDWCICQLDESNAFLHGNLDEDVFMEQPENLWMLPILIMFIAYTRLSKVLNKHLGHASIVSLKHYWLLGFSPLK